MNGISYIRKGKIMKRKVLKTAIILSTALTLSGLCGCGSDSSTAVAESESESEPVAGKGVAGEKYKADFNGHTYEFVDEDMTWEEARKACISRGGHLATVTSAKEQEYLEEMFININGNERGPWFGGYSDGAYGGDKNDWCWVTGEKWNYTNWADGEPSNAEGTEWFTHFWNEMKWNDINNDDTRDSQKGYICEYDSFSDILDDGGNEASAETTGKAEQKDHGDLPVFNGHAYEFIANPVSWTEARKYCDSVGGHLLTITSPEEQKFIENTFSGKMFWIGAYSNGVYGGDIYDWRWVTGEEWYYENFTDGEPSNSDGEEWFGCIWKKMKWNDLREGDPGNRLDGFVCEFDDLPDLFEADGSINPMSDPPEMEEFDSEVDNEWEKALKESTKEDPFIKDLGDGRYAIQSHWRGVQIKYPISYVAGEDGDALYVYDGDSMYIYARNITTAAEDYKGSLASFCAARAEEQVVEDFTRLYGAPTNMDGVKREGGDGKNRICSIRGNMWNGNADMAFSSKVVISGKKNNFLVLYTVFWRYGDDEARSHTGNINVTSWGKGDMYG